MSAGRAPSSPTEPAPTGDASLACDLTLARSEFVLHVSAQVRNDGITGVFGPSGFGKTSLLRTLAGLEPGVRGRLQVAGEDWHHDAAGVARPPYQRALGMVFQEPRLFAHLSVEENLRYALKRRGERHGLSLEEAVQLLSLGPLLVRRPQALSGGERQRVAIARAALCAPRLLLMDEPLSALDAARRDEVLPFLAQVQRRLGVPMLYVSHSLDELIRLCAHLLVMEHGHIVANDTLPNVLASMPSALLRGDAAGVALSTTVQAYDAQYDLTEVRAHTVTLQLPGEVAAPGQSVRVHIQARDVGLSLQPPQVSSLLNVCPVRVSELIDPVSGKPADPAQIPGPFVIARCQAGEDVLLARITRRSCALLNLAAGSELYAQIKSAAVRSA